MKRTVFYSSSLFFRLFIGPVPVYYDFIQNFLLLSLHWTRKAALCQDSNLHSWKSPPLVPSSDRKGRRFRRLRRPRSLIQGRPARLLRGRRESGAEGWVPFVLPRLCSTGKTSHDVSRWKHLCPLLLGRKVRMRPVMDMNS